MHSAAIGTVMDNNDQEKFNSQQRNSDNSARSEIPLWLQGLDEPMTGEKPPEEVIESKPAGSRSEEEKPAVPPQASDMLDEQDGAAVPTDDEGFIEISGFDLNSEQAQEDNEEILPEEEELPEWLHEMIEETPGSSVEETMISVISEPEEVAPTPVTLEEVVDEVVNEPTEPVDITQETPAEIEEGLVEPLEVPFEPMEGNIVEEILEEIIIEEPEEPESMEAIQPETPEEFDLEIEDDEVVEEKEIPRALLFGKFLLEQGDTKQAVEIFNSYIDQSVYKDQIKEWLINAGYDNTSISSDLWESLGDIEMHDGNAEQAFVAYTKAIDILLSSIKGSDEMD